MEATTCGFEVIGERVLACPLPFAGAFPSLGLTRILCASPSLGSPVPVSRRGTRSQQAKIGRPLGKSPSPPDNYIMPQEREELCIVLAAPKNLRRLLLSLFLPTDERRGDDQHAPARLVRYGGQTGIRIQGTLPCPAVFKTAAFDRSAICP